MAARKNWNKVDSIWSLFYRKGVINYKVGSVVQEGERYAVYLYSLEDPSLKIPCKNKLLSTQEAKLYLTEVFDRILKKDIKDKTMFTYYNLLCYDVLKT